MPVDVLRCRVCESEYPAEANGICARCFGPLEPVYDWDELARAVSRESIEAGPRSLWRYGRAAARRAAGGRGERAGLDAARAGAAAGARARRRRGLAEARPREPDALVQGPRRRGRGGEGARVRARRRSRPRRPATSRTPSPRARPRTGMHAVIFCPAGLEPEKLAATTVYGATVYGVRGSYDDCSRLVSEFAGEVEWGIVNVNLRSYYAEGSKTLAFEISRAARLGDPGRGRSCRSAPARCSRRSCSASSSSSGSA